MESKFGTKFEGVSKLFDHVAHGGNQYLIEASYYDQKTFWSLCNYMILSCKGIEMMLNLVTITYYVMKLLPLIEKAWSKYRHESVQKTRYAMSEQIREQIVLQVSSIPRNPSKIKCTHQDIETMDFGWQTNNKKL